MPAVQYRRSLPQERLSTIFPNLKHTLYQYPPSSQRTIRTINFNPLGNLIATGGSDRLLRVWNPEKPNLKFSTELKGHTSAIERIDWDPTRADRLASVDGEGCVKFWDVRTAGSTGECKVGGSGLSICWRPDADSIVVGRKVSSWTLECNSRIAGRCTHHHRLTNNDCFVDA
jgi:THO complex subunit 3